MTRGPMTSIGPYRVSFSIAFALDRGCPFADKPKNFCTKMRPPRFIPSAGADYLSVFIFRSRPEPCGGSGGPPARGGWSRG